MEKGWNIDMKEEIEEMAEERGQTREKGSNLFSYLVFLGALGILAMIFIFTLRQGGSGRISGEDVNLINDRILQLEKKLAQFEETAKKMDRLEIRMKGIQGSLSEVDSSGRSVNRRLDELSDQIARLQKRPASGQASTKTSKNLQKSPVSKGKRKYHEVRRGDTLFGIAKKYDLSIDELRRINKFSKEQEIHPGQKILVISE